MRIQKQSRKCTDKVPHIGVICGFPIMCLSHELYGGNGIAVVCVNFFSMCVSSPLLLGGLIFVFYEGIRFELGNRSPYTFQIVEDVRSPTKQIWLRNMVHKALRLSDQRSFEEITFVIKRTGKLL